MYVNLPESIVSSVQIKFKIKSSDLGAHPWPWLAHIALFIPYFIATIPYSPSVVYVRFLLLFFLSFEDMFRSFLWHLSSVCQHFCGSSRANLLVVLVGLRSGPSSGGEARRACVPADAQSTLVAGWGCQLQWWFQCLKWPATIVQLMFSPSHSSTSKWNDPSIVFQST